MKGKGRRKDCSMKKSLASGWVKSCEMNWKRKPVIIAMLKLMFSQCDIIVACQE